MSQVQIMQQRVLDGFAALPPPRSILGCGLLVCTFFGGLGFGMHTMKQSLAAAKDGISTRTVSATHSSLADRTSQP